MEPSMGFQAKLPKTRQSFHHVYVSVTGLRSLEQKRQRVSVDRNSEVSRTTELDKLADAA